MAKQRKQKKGKQKSNRSVGAVRSAAAIKSSSGKQIDLQFKQAVDLQRLHNNSEAEKVYMTILEIHPGHVPSMIQMARLALLKYRLPKAFQYAREAVKVNHASPQAHLVLGEVLSRGGLAEHAESELTIALQLDKQNPEIINGLGKAYTLQGRFEEAIVLFRQAIAIKPDYLSAYYNLAASKRFTREDEDFELINRLSDIIDSRNTDDQILIHFILGKVFHDCKEFDRAFKEYQQGNDLKSKQVNYDIEEEEEAVDRTIHTLDKSWLEKHAGKGNNAEGAIFIVGMPRSGTTLLETLLCRHPQISGIGERSYITKLATTGGDRFHGDLEFPEVLNELSGDDLREFGNDYMTWAHEFGVDTTYTIDKTPGNFLYLGFILAILPNAKLIHNFRNPVDNCLSVYQGLFATGIPFSYDLEHIGRYYLMYRKIMEHWKKIFPEKILDVNYEDVVNDTEQQIRRVIEFCELPWDERCLEEGQKQHVSNTASKWQARQPVYKTSVQRWKNYEKHLGPLLEILAPFTQE